jgi:predicted ATPase
LHERVVLSIGVADAHLHLGNFEEAEAELQAALAMAQQQSVRLYELQAARLLARIWQSQGKRDEALDLLSPIYGWFTEGFDTRDLVEAKTLLEELG